MGQAPAHDTNYFDETKCNSNFTLSDIISQRYRPQRRNCPRPTHESDSKLPD